MEIEDQIMEYELNLFENTYGLESINNIFMNDILIKGEMNG